MKRKNYIQALEELLKDKARLDRIEKCNGHMSFVDGAWDCFINDPKGCGLGKSKNIREAIDVALCDYDKMLKDAESFERWKANMQNEQKPVPKTSPRPRKPLFIPLIKKYYLAFACGLKSTEYRVHGKKWNETTCFPGRKVILSCGYSGPRMEGVIEGVHYDNCPATNIPNWAEIYGTGAGQAICIRIKDIRDYKTT